MTNEEHDRAEVLFLVGQLAGVSRKINIEALEKFLKKQPPLDFRYAKESLAALTFYEDDQRPIMNSQSLSVNAEAMLRDAWHLCWSSRAKARIDSLLHYCGKRTESRAQRPLSLPTKGES